ncbi:piggyBac transposable element-derived protein 3-like [Rhagoletis pomonella]|uniref:piggyBac transposable element-derived protein 3-like n=1 Tax=Rhagoletis pomonella TaxID=28610 RepID=UPI00177A983B|nr:piggyBac transposable element-derived protein 3-like [Rhagoletis pomonella]
MRKRKIDVLRTEEILELLEAQSDDERDIEKIFLEPPDEENFSDEDSSNEDEGGTLRNLSKRQRMTNCEVVYAGTFDDDFEEDNPVAEDELAKYIKDVLEHSSSNVETNLLETPPRLKKGLPTTSSYKNNTSMTETSQYTASNPVEVATSTHQTIPLVVEMATSSQQMTPPFEQVATSPESTPQKLPESYVRLTPPKLPRRMPPRITKPPAKRQKKSQPVPVASMKQTRSRAIMNKDLNWVAQEEYARPLNIFPDLVYPTAYDIAPYTFFEKFFDGEVVNLLCDQTNKYAVFKDPNKPSPAITPQEMRVFLGILIVTGYRPAPAKRDYWSEEDDMGSRMIQEAMRRHRFETIHTNLHFADMSQYDEKDKIWKLRPLTDKLKERFRKNFVPEQHLSYDESMVEYFGRHSCKQFIRGKPVRFGYKMRSLNTPQGYLINFEMYQGSNPRINPAYIEKYPKPTAPSSTKN